MADINSRLPTQDQSDGATGSAIPTEAILVGGSDGTNLQPISTTSTGVVNTKDQSDGPVTPGTVSSFSQLIGGQYNSTQSALTTGQQAALQSDVRGNLLIGSGSVAISGSIAGNGNILLIPGAGLTNINSYSGILIEISGTWSSTLTLTGSNSGSSFFTIDVINLSNPNNGPQSTITSNGLYYAPIGATNIALTSSSYVSGTVLCYAQLRSIPPAILNAPFKTDVSTTGTLGALNATLQLPINDISSAYALISGTWVGTVQFQGSVNGSTYVPLEAVQGGPTNAYTTAGFTTNGGVRIALPAGFTNIQAIMTAYTSGTATVVLNTSPGVSNIEAIQLNAANLKTTAYTVDGSGNAINSINSQLETADIINTSISSGSITVGTTAVAARVGASNLTSRKQLMIAPVTYTIYLGATSGVTTATGIPIYPGQVVAFAYGASVTPYLIAATSGTVNVFEGA